MAFLYWLIWAHFFHYNKLDDLIEYETSLPPRSDIKAKGLCLYNKDEFNWRLTRIQRKKLFEHHGRELMITTTPTVKWQRMSIATSIEYGRWRIVVFHVLPDRIFSLKYMMYKLVERWLYVLPITSLCSRCLLCQ